MVDYTIDNNQEAVRQMRRCLPWLRRRKCNASITCQESHESRLFADQATIPWNGVTSYINGYAVKPVIGKQLRLLCHPVGLPPPPYGLSMTYLLVR